MLLLLILVLLPLIIFTILKVRIKIDFSLNDDLNVTVKFLGLKKQLYPEVPKRFPVRRFKKGYPQARKKISVLDASVKYSISADEKISGVSSDSVGDKIYSVVYFYKLFFSNFFKHLRLDTSKVVVLVGGKDAASAAISYGVISQAVAYLLDFLDKNFKIRKRHKSDIRVLCDFTSKETVYDIFISTSLNIWQVIDIIRALVYNYFNKMVQYDSQKQTTKGDIKNGRKQNQ